MSGKNNITVGIDKPDTGNTTIINQNDVALEQRVSSLENAQGVKTGAVSKVFVIWDEIGYQYKVTYPLYYINGVAFPAGEKTITLDPAHATLDRTDTFGLNALGAFAIKGTPALEPIAPTVDSSNEIFVTTVLVKANTTEPAPNPVPVSNVVVYNENTEFQTSSITGISDFNFTGKPFAGTKSIRIVGKLGFKDTLNVHEASSFEALRLKLLQNYNGTGFSSFNFRFLLNDTAVSSTETVQTGIDYPLAKNPAVYETVLIDLNRFTFISDNFNQIEITPVKGNRFTGYSLIDSMVLITKSIHVVSSPPVDTSLFVEKSSFRFQDILNQTGVVIDLDVSRKVGNGYAIKGTITELHSLYNSNNYVKFFYGQDLYIKNDQETPFIIKHNSGIIAQQRYIFLCPNKQDVTINPGEIFHFKNIMSEYNGGTLEFVGMITNLSKLITDAEEKETIHDDDKLGIADSEDNDKTKFWKWSTIKAFFDNLFEKKENKGVANGYAPLDATIKIAAEYLNIVNDLVTGGATSLLSAEQGKQLELQISAINSILFSDNVNMDTIQEIVDAIENVQGYLATILVNDLTTGGTTKALTAEMGKNLKGLVDALATAKFDTANVSQNIEADKTSTTKVSSVKQIYDWTVGIFQTWILSINPITGITYTIGSNDYKTKNTFTNASAVALTVPTNASVAIPIGTKFSYTVQGAGTVTVGGAGITFVQKNLVYTTGNTFILEKIATDTWVVDGNATSLPTVTSGEKVVTVKSDGVHIDYDIIDPFTGATSVATLDAADWSTGSVTATGAAGERRFGSTYEYVCTGTNNWRRNINYGMLVKDFVLGNVNDTAGVKTSVQMTALYPNAVSPQIVIGYVGMYQYLGSNGWFYFENKITP